MIAVQVIPDRFAKQQAALVKASQTHDGSIQNHIRRPTRGIVLKEETFATLRVVAGNGQNLLLVDSGSRRGPKKDEFYEINGKRATDVYSNFFLQQIQEERAEKQQILESFGEAYIFLFGERARIITFQGVLLNTFDFNWEAEWWHNYESYLRGTRCVENNARVFISYDETIVSGYIIGAAATKSTTEPNHVNFQFQLFVTSSSNFSNIGRPEAGQGVDYQNSYSESFSEDFAKRFRPGLIDTRTANDHRIIDGAVDSSGQKKMPSLTEGMQSQGLLPVLQTFTRAKQIAEAGLKKISNALAGEVIRVPIGFEGSLAFDQETDVQLKDVKFGGEVVYTTFDKNEDEYVGRGTHYGTSMLGIDSASKLSFTDPAAEEKSIKYTMDKARKVWRDAGFEVPESHLGTLSAFVAAGKVGLLALGATQDWRSRKSDTEPEAKVR